MDNSKNFKISQFSPQVNVANFFNLKKRASCWGPRFITDFELILVMKGVYKYEEFGEADLILNPHDLLVIPPFHKHRLVHLNENKNNAALACIHNHPIPSWEKGYHNILKGHAIKRKTSLNQEDYFLMADLFKGSAKIFNSNRQYRKELLSSLCRQIWLMAGAYWISPHSIQSQTERMDEMVQYICDNLSHPLSRKDLADQFDLTPEYVNAIFKKELGMTPSQVINREKILKGYIMLHNEGLSVKETAYTCGFTDEYYFARLFKKILGISPGAVKGGMVKPVFLDESAR